MNRKIFIAFLAWCLAVMSLPLWGNIAQSAEEFTRLRSDYQGLPPNPQTLSPTGERVAEYYIAPNDKLNIYVWQNPDLTQDVTVRPDGKLSYPLVGTIDVAGLTLDSLQKLVKEKLSKFVRVPQVIVSLRESAGNKVIVLGQVNYPGIFTFKGNAINVLEVIAMAGDFTTDGRKTCVMIISDNFTNHPKVRRLDLLTAEFQGIFKKTDMFVRPNDVVYVPRSTIADFNKFLSDIMPTVNMATSLIGLGSSGITTATQAKAFFWHRTVKVVDGN